MCHADKPPISELQHFLEFQLPTRWAPEFGVLAVGPEGKQHHSASLQFKFMGPKLYVNTNQAINSIYGTVCCLCGYNRWQF